MTTRTPTGIILPTLPERIIKTRSGKEKSVEYKIIAESLKATNDSLGIVEGYLNTIGNIDYGNDRTKPGAFKRTLDLSYKRKKANGDQFLWPYLYNHSVDVLPAGGIFDAEEDTKGLYIKAQLNLDYQLGRDMYSSYKFGSLKKQSMGYLAHQTDYVREEGQLIRDLIEVEILEGSGVIFPMNDSADVTSIKRQGYWPGFSTKTICGNTSGPIGPRDESWDGSKAEGQIWDAAYNDDTGKITVATAKKYFMVCDGDGSKKGDYSYPFWYLKPEPHICVGAVKAIAGAASGARGASAPDGIKAKVETLYKRINRKYPDDPQLTPPWSDDGKGGKPRMATKDFNDLYQAAQAADCLEDWGDLINTLTQTMLQIFGMGDTPQTDMPDALEQFGQAVEAWMEKAVECNLDDYISDQGYCNGGTPYVPYSLQAGIGYMTRNGTHDRKAGAAFSQANTDAVYQHMANLHAMADEQAKAMHDAADGLQEALSGLGAPSNPSWREQGTTSDDEKSFRRARWRKAGAEFSKENLQMLSEHTSDLHDVADTIHQMAEDLAQNTGASTYTDPSGNPDPAKETDKDKANSRNALGRKHSLFSTAVDGGDLSIGAALAELGQLTVKK